jgi:hypothetical protein
MARRSHIRIRVTKTVTMGGSVMLAALLGLVLLLLR